MSMLNQRQMSLGLILGALAALWWASGGSVCSASDQQKSNLEQSLQEQAPRILADLGRLGMKRVGVLKFRVSMRPGEASDNCGEFNMRLAERLEAALVLANPREPERQIGLVRKASRVARRLKGANHLTVEGRKQLFSAQYPMAWGKESVSVEAFLTGVAEFQPNRKTVRVHVLLVKPDEENLIRLGPPFVVTTDRTVLKELGGSFHLRGVPGEDPAELARQSEENPEERFPLQDRPAVMLKVFYDGHPVAIELRNEGAWIPEPREGQNVRLELHRLDDGDVSLGVVLKVNGENTLPGSRGRWVLDPGCPPCVIRGFSKDGERASGFRVASQARSQALAMNYGQEAGMISLAVYQQASAPSAPDASHLAPDLMAISEADFPDRPVSTLAALQRRLRANAAGSVSRGLIEKGNDIAQAFEETKRDWEPEPFISMVIRYYQPRR